MFDELVQNTANNNKGKTDSNDVPHSAHLGSEGQPQFVTRSVRARQSDLAQSPPHNPSFYLNIAGNMDFAGQTEETSPSGTSTLLLENHPSIPLRNSYNKIEDFIHHNSIAGVPQNNNLPLDVDLHSDTSFNNMNSSQQVLI
jgi:hypothetical protein